MMKGLYIHVPFCAGKCPYCAFYSKHGTEQQYENYTKAVIRAITLYPHDFAAKTIYFGGGTPSLLGADRLCRILNAARQRFGENQVEITVEANPCSITPDMLKALVKGGFNRISFGVQSLNDELLKTLGRKHDAAAAVSAILAAKNAGFEHISADLMLALPNQTVLDIENSIEKLCALPIDHLSAYILKVEQNTAFFSRYDEPDEDTAADHYAAMQNKCENLGFSQYEISNFAKNSAAQGQHNLGYWRCEEYLGIGPSAHSFMFGKRFYFESDIDAFVNSPNPWLDIIDDGIGGDEEERLMLGLRLSEGVYLNSFSDDFSNHVKSAAKPLIKADLLKTENDRLFITTKGYIVSNSIIASLL